ncbi:MAG: hypothetical protein ACJZ81_06375 [Paracoccaceae bacterium]
MGGGLSKSVRVVVFEVGPKESWLNFFWRRNAKSFGSKICWNLSLQKINKLWGINKDCEISIEANPNSVSEVKFKRLKEIGINRVSVGSAIS